MAVLLVLVTIALYWPATRCDFINYDDPDYVTANPHVQGGLNWEGVKWAFGNTEQAAYWAPLMWLSHMLACQFFGLNAWGHHLINVLLHAANTALVFLVFQRMTRATWRSLILAALFGMASAAGGIGGLGHGAQGRVEHALLDADYVGLCEVCGSSPSPAFKIQSLVRRSPGHVWAWLDEQGDAGDDAVCFAAAGLLAAGENGACRMQSQSQRRDTRRASAHLRLT